MSSTETASLKKRLTVKKYKCDDCGEEFDNIFEYFDVHEMQIDMILPLGKDLDLNIMDMLRDLYELNVDGEKEEVSMILTAVASTLYAYAKGYLPEIMHNLEDIDEDYIDEIVNEEVKDLDKQIQKLLRSRENGGY